MGASLGTRNITLVNDEKGGVIKVSDSLAHRLRGQLEDSQASKETDPPPSSDTAPPQPAPPPPPRQPTPPPRASPQREEIRNGGGLEAWTTVYAGEARRALLRLQDEQDQAIATVEQRWRDKMADREKLFLETAQLSAAELQQTASEVEATLVHGPVSAVCQDCQTQVLGCYRQHPQQTLKCADTVQQFSRCVDLSRLQCAKDGSQRVC